MVVHFNRIGWTFSIGLNTHPNATRRTAFLAVILACPHRHEIHADESGITIRPKLGEKVLEQRRYYTQSIIDVISFLCKHEIAFRGNWDELSESETGLFNGFFEFTLTRDAKLRECERAMPPNITFKLSQIQNEIIELLSKSLTGQISTEVSIALFLTLMVDGTKDKMDVRLFLLLFDTY